VRDALSRLDEKQRTILVLREFEGCDYRTIAETMDLTMGTVRSRLSRARAQLKKELTVYLASRPSENFQRLREEDWYDHGAALPA
jgi:DNA-directed RNA polymerase specialized sigma24 family protein